MPMTRVALAHDAPQVTVGPWNSPAFLRSASMAFALVPPVLLILEFPRLHVVGATFGSLPGICIFFILWFAPKFVL
jgi:hypothetical protein